VDESDTVSSAIEDSKVPVADKNLSH